MIKILMVFVILLSVFNCEAKTYIKNYFKDVEILHFNSGVSLIDCIYIINLKNRTQKWTKVEKAFNFYGIYPNRVDAINGWALSLHDKKILSGNYSLRLRGGQIGCILSHLSALYDASKRNYNLIWVCEDDVQICKNPHALSHLIAALSRIDPEWDVLYTDSDSKNSLGETVSFLGADFRPEFLHEELSYYIKRELIDEDFLKINQRFGAYSMIISKSGIEKILSHFTENYLWTAYDIDVHYVPSIRQYCLSYDLVSINYHELSDTESDKHALWTSEGERLK